MRKWKIIVHRLGRYTVLLKTVEPVDEKSTEPNIATGHVSRGQVVKISCDRRVLTGTPRFAPFFFFFFRREALKEQFGKDQTRSDPRSYLFLGTKKIQHRHAERLGLQEELSKSWINSSRVRLKSETLRKHRHQISIRIERPEVLLIVTKK